MVSNPTVKVVSASEDELMLRVRAATEKGAKERAGFWVTRNIYSETFGVLGDDEIESVSGMRNTYEMPVFLVS